MVITWAWAPYRLAHGRCAGLEEVLYAVLAGCLDATSPVDNIKHTALSPGAADGLWRRLPLGIPIHQVRFWGHSRTALLEAARIPLGPSLR